MNMNIDSKKQGGNSAVSKFLSYVLRHQPDSIGLFLDKQGWADLDELIAKGNAAGQALTRELVSHVVQTSDKKRFSVSPDGRRIRAAQGHSTAQVDITFEARVPPA